EAAAPYDQMPLFVRAGSIIPMGPELAYTTEKKADAITLYVYTGADGRFSLYEDDGVTNQYQKGAYSRIGISWSDASRTLRIGKREGAFEGMPGERLFHLVVVSGDGTGGFAFEPVGR